MWYNASWTNRVKLTIDNTKVSADLTDYVGYIDLAQMPAGFWTTVQNGGGDIRITKTDGETELAREIVTCDTTAETGEVHFKLTGTLSSSADTDIYVYFGNSGASDYAVDATYGRNNVWDSNYRAVYHFSETSGSRYDSTVNGQTLSDVNTVTSGAGKLGTGGDFESTNSEYLTKTGSIMASVPTAITASAWITRESVATGGPANTISNEGTNKGFWWLRTEDNPSDKVGFSIQNTSTTTFTAKSTTNIGTGSPYYVVGSWDSSNIKIYVNGSLEHTVATTGTIRTTVALNYICGAFTSPGNYFDGIIDENRVSNSALSASWITTEYNNQSAPATFYTVGSVESDGGTVNTTMFVLNF